MAGYRVRVRRVQDNFVVYDSEIDQAECNVTIVDRPGAGAWSYILELIVNGSTTATLLTNRNTIAATAFSR